MDNSIAIVGQFMGVVEDRSIILSNTISDGKSMSIRTEIPNTLIREIDVLKNKTREIKLYSDKGLVKLIDCMPRLLAPGKSTSDYRIAEMARTSYGKQVDLKSDEDDSRLISYLIENYHTSPLEGIKFTFLIKCPIYVARQLERHRTANINEYSMRYSEAIDEFYFPEPRAQDKTNKQQSVDFKFDPETISLYKSTCESTANMIKIYNEFLKRGIAREVSRSILCTAEMTQLYWVMDLHNLFKFLKLRCDRAHAQKEIADLADAIFELIKPIVPAACKAFEKYWLQSVSLTQEDLAVIKSNVPPEIFRKSIDSSKLSVRQKKDLLRKLGL